MVQIHKTFTDEQVRELMQRSTNQQVDRKHLQELFGIKERRFFDLLKRYKENPQNWRSCGLLSSFCNTGVWKYMGWILQVIIFEGVKKSSTSLIH